MNLEEKFVRNITKYEGKIFTMLVDEVLCPNGNSATREIVSHRGGVCIAPITQDGQLIFIRQYRYAYKKVLREAARYLGMIFDDADEQGVYSL